MLRCEKLIRNGSRPRDEVHSFPYRCGRPAAKIEVFGLSFSAIATLCKMHLRLATKEFPKYRFLTKPPWQGE